MHQLVARAGLYAGLQRAFRTVGIRWSGCDHEDRGDGVFILVPAEVPKKLFVERVPYELIEAVREHNATHPVPERIRLRLALHAGEVNYDDHGATSTSVVQAFRLVDADPLRAALKASPGVLALITSAYFFDEVVSHSAVIDPTTYRHVTIVAKESKHIGWISLPDHPYPQRAAAPLTTVPSPQPRQLPAHTPHFVGRVHELNQLTAQLGVDGNTVVISAINGTAGIGKTALAIHWAHHVSTQFPDGQLYVNLRGFHPASAPMHPAEAIRGFLDAFHIPAERIPASLDAQAALYRSLLADRHVLVVLDNARDADQVRPLLPGSSTCLVVITSRDQLAALITCEGANPVNLDVLTLTEANTLLTRRIGPQRVGAEPDAVHALIGHCAGLPLALAIVAARVELNPTLSLQVLADELANERTRLDMLDELRVVFSWSYQHLEPSVARMFRLLGTHPGPEFSLAAAASLNGISIDQARFALAALTRAHLLAEPNPGRFTFHDLVRAYAANQASAIDTDDDRRSATHRLLDHYLHASVTANDYVAPYRDVTIEEPPQPDVTLPPIQSYQQATMWLDTEHRTLLAGVRHAYRTGFDIHAWKLAWSLGAFLDRRGRWRDLLSIEHCVLAAVYRLGDGFAKARSHLLLGWPYAQLGREAEAQRHFERSVALCREVGDRDGEAATHFALAVAWERKEHYAEAIHHAQWALDLFQATGYRAWQARTHRVHAWIHGRHEEHSLAVDHCQKALRLVREVGDLHYEAATLDSLARAHRNLGNLPQAITHSVSAINLYRNLGDHYNEANTLRRLGDIHQTIGDLAAAHEAWQQALKILNLLNLPDADQIRVKLRTRCEPQAQNTKESGAHEETKRRQQVHSRLWR
jgi:tetratricopeptide (TPR) repeat protein